MWFTSTYSKAGNVDIARSVFLKLVDLAVGSDNPVRSNRLKYGVLSL